MASSGEFLGTTIGQAQYVQCSQTAVPIAPPVIGKSLAVGISQFFFFFFKCLFLNIFRISPGLPNVTEEFIDVNKIDTREDM